MTGVYDPALQLIYWTTGNPSPDYNGDDRLGDNLYTSSVVALDARSGPAQVALPVHAAQRVGLGRAAADGARRHRVGRASRASCSCRRAATGSSTCSIAPTESSCWRKPFVKQSDLGERNRTRRPARLNTRTGADARRHDASVRRLTARPTGIRRLTVRRPGSITCRRSRTATSSSRAVSDWAAGKSYMGGSTRQAPDAPNQKILRAIDVKTGQGRLGAAADGTGRRAGRHAGHRQRPRVLLRRSGSIRRRRRGNRKTALALSDEQRVARVADDLSVRRQAARRHRVGLEHHGVRAGGVEQMQQEIGRRAGH